MILARARRPVFLLLAAALFASWPGRASAYCRSTTCVGNKGKKCAVDEDGCKIDGLPLFWKTSCVGISAQQSGTQQLGFDQVNDAIDAALAAWADAPCLDGGTAAISFARLKSVSCRRTEFNQNGQNANVVMFRDDEWTYTGSDNTLAFTTVSFDPETGEIYDADIEVNAVTRELTVGDTGVAFDLQSILTHEFGHLLGLAHTPDEHATMYAAYVQGSTSQRELAPDDLNAVCAAYPPDAPAVCDPTPYGGFSSTCAAVKVDATPQAAPSQSCSFSPPAAPSAARAFPFGALALAAGLRRARRRLAAVSRRKTRVRA